MKKNKDLSDEDIKTWKDYLENPADLTDKDHSNNRKIPNKKRFVYDLHGYSLEEANIKTKEIVISCYENNFKEILLITGKGIHSDTEKDVYSSKKLSTLKYSVPEFINNDSDISNFILSVAQADPSQGGEGAILIKLKKL